MVDIGLFQCFISFPSEFFSLGLGHPSEILLQTECAWIETIPEDVGFQFNLALWRVGVLRDTCYTISTLIYARIIEIVFFQSPTQGTVFVNASHSARPRCIRPATPLDELLLKPGKSSLPDKIAI